MRAGEVLLGPLSLDASSTSPEPWSPTPNWAGEAGFCLARRASRLSCRNPLQAVAGPAGRLSEQLKVMCGEDVVARWAIPLRVLC